MTKGQGAPQRKKYADYIQAIVSPTNAKWVTDNFVKDRRIALYGIDICISVELSGEVELSPVIPCAGPLSRLVQRHPSDTAFRFDRKNRRWMVQR
jgi:hypothetical protein